jgi:hypothetical protein
MSRTPIFAPCNDSPCLARRKQLFRARFRMVNIASAQNSSVRAARFAAACSLIARPALLEIIAKVGLTRSSG